MANYYLPKEDVEEIIAGLWSMARQEALCNAVIFPEMKKKYQHHIELIKFFKNLKFGDKIEHIETKPDYNKEIAKAFTDVTKALMEASNDKI